MQPPNLPVNPPNVQQAPYGVRIPLLAPYPFTFETIATALKGLYPDIENLKPDIQRLPDNESKRLMKLCFPPDTDPSMPPKRKRNITKTTRKTLAAATRLVSQNPVRCRKQLINGRFTYTTDKLQNDPLVNIIHRAFLFLWGEDRAKGIHFQVTLVYWNEEAIPLMLAKAKALEENYVQRTPAHLQAQALTQYLVVAAAWSAARQLNANLYCFCPSRQCAEQVNCVTHFMIFRIKEETLAPITNHMFMSAYGVGREGLDEYRKKHFSTLQNKQATYQPTDVRKQKLP